MRGLIALLLATPALADEGSQTVETPPIRDQIALSDAAFTQCLSELDALGVVYEALAEPIIADDDPDCGVLRPIAVSEVAPGVQVRPDSAMRCPTAAAFARWTQDVVVPAAEAYGERGALTGIDHSSTYSCRRRGGDPEGKPSEHSFGSAIDIAGFRFAEGEALAVEPRADTNDLAEAFQRAVRGGACLYFTTVLGPGTDAAHADHFHFDVKQRRGGYRICQ
ncbi:MAG: extensin-like domain-containing protein [Shimia sp.]